MGNAPEAYCPATNTLRFPGIEFWCKHRNLNVNRREAIDPVAAKLSRIGLACLANKIALRTGETEIVGTLVWHAT